MKTPREVVPCGVIVSNDARARCTKESDHAGECEFVPDRHAAIERERDLLRALADDIRERYECRCFVDDLPDGEACPCEGSGRVETNRGERDGHSEDETCWRCQATAAIEQRDRERSVTSDVDEIARLKALINRDRTGLVLGLDKARKVARGFRWIAEGRGPYAYDDDRYRQETGNLIDQVVAIAEEHLKASGSLADEAFHPTEARQAAPVAEVDVDGIAGKWVERLNRSEQDQALDAGWPSRRWMSVRDAIASAIREALAAQKGGT